ncbi:G5 domain-containing protein [Desulfitobacterium sp.]|uniref:G5 domain-containing protein n=1 Tax=Desulfitobacterium sp. TaxID=49981 RepID=UPI0039C855B0
MIPFPPGQEWVKQEGVQGYKVTTTRTVLLNGKLIKTEVLSSSYYALTPKIEIDPANLGETAVSGSLSLCDVRIATKN